MKRYVTVVQNGIIIYEADDPADEICVSALTLGGVSAIDLHITLTDACGESALRRHENGNARSGKHPWRRSS